MEENNKKKSSGFDKIVTIILVLIIAALAGVTIYQMMSPSEELHRAESTSSEAITVNVSATVATRKEFINTTRFQGDVISDESNISVLPETAGTLNSIEVSRGDKVALGDIVAFVDPSRPGAQYSLSPVRAKASGEVITINATVGSTVTATTPIITIMPEKTLYVSTSIPERYISTLSLGLSGTVTSIAYPSESYAVEVSYISPILNTTSRALPVELSFTGDHGKILEGMYVSIDLVTERIEDALIVPSSAISSYGGQPIVYVVENGTTSRRYVETGSSNSTETVILSGLEEGEVVVTAGSVAEGTRVSIV